VQKCGACDYKDCRWGFAVVIHLVEESWYVGEPLKNVIQSGGLKV